MAVASRPATLNKIPVKATIRTRTEHYLDGDRPRPSVMQIHLGVQVHALQLNTCPEGGGIKSPVSCKGWSTGQCIECYGVC